MHKHSLYALATAAMTAIFLVSCTATKTDWMLPPPLWEEALDFSAKWDESEIHESGEVGTSTDLYGEGVIAELGVPYEESVSFDPKLRYNVIYFDFNRSQIKGYGHKVLHNHARYLRSNPNTKVALEGHTDERGSAGYNLALGERRALSARDFLLVLQVPPTQITWVSYGEEKPAVEGKNDEDYARNRRVEILYRQQSEFSNSIVHPADTQRKPRLIRPGLR